MFSEKCAAQKQYGANPHKLLEELAESREGGGFPAVKIAVHTTVYGGDGEGKSQDL